MRKYSGGIAAAIILLTFDFFPSLGDCPKICVKAMTCKAAPFAKVEDCTEACEGAAEQEDDSTAKTYDCIAKAKTCQAAIKCGH